MPMKSGRGGLHGYPNDDARLLPRAAQWDRRRSIFLAVVLIATALVYLHVLGNDFVNYDDAANIVRNYTIRSLTWHSVRTFFTSVHVGYWIPLTWLSHALVYRFFGLDPAMHHLFNVILHLANTALIFLLTTWVVSWSEVRGDAKQPRTQVSLIAASVAALLFGLHPLQVESVAWATERKDALYSLFFLLSVIAYFRSRVTPPIRLVWLAVSWVAFVMAAMSKPTAVTLPVVLLLIDYWPLRLAQGRLIRAVIEKVPFFLVSAVVGLITVRTQGSVGALHTNQAIAEDLIKSPHTGVMHAVGQLLNVFYAVAFYLKHTIVPIHLGFYSWRPLSILSIGNLISLLLFVAIAAACVTYRKSRPALTIAWLAYLVILAPSFGVLPSMADRFTYLSNGCLFMLAGGAVALAVSRLPRSGSAAILVIGILVVGTLSFLTFRQIEMWKDSISLWQRAVQIRPSMFATEELVIALRRAGRLEEARYYCDSPVWTAALAHDCKGSVMLNERRWSDAVIELRAAIGLNPLEPRAYQDIWIAYDALGMSDEALAAARKAIELSPDLAENHSKLAISFGRKGMAGESEAALRKALSLEPDNPEFLNNLAVTYQHEGKLDAAIALLLAAQQRNPSEILYAINLGSAYSAKDLRYEAIAQYARAVKIAPSSAEAHLKLADAYDRVGRTDQANTHYRAALNLGSHLQPALLQRLAARRSQ